MFGFVNVYKPKGLTSFDVVAQIRKIAGLRSVGHSGTLDPMACGVLPVALGKATKLIEYLPDDKEYIATIQFGSNTSTYDAEGEVTQVFDKKIDKILLEKALKSFEGEISQFPPIYSAIKIKGKKLYEYARKGENVEIKPRKVHIFKIELVEFSFEQQIAVIKVACSKGTYIRSIAFDLGKKLECGGHLVSLERTKAGMFCVETSVNLDELTNENLQKNMLNPLDVLPQTQYVLSDEEKERVIHGLWIKNRLKFKNLDFTNQVVFLVYGGKMFGVGKIDKDRILVKKVFEV